MNAHFDEYVGYVYSLIYELYHIPIYTLLDGTQIYFGSLILWSIVIAFIIHFLVPSRG